MRKTGHYGSQSEADLAMLNRLVRLADGSPTRMCAIFRETGLVRDKNECHPTYLARTIHKAIGGMGWRPGQSCPVEEER